ncbi:MAG TPA: HAD-IIA family hydrolase [Chloroflexota bacterium]|nr:HAD-IIA family hydrolase [Chloroflexota bacterium]
MSIADRFDHFLFDLDGCLYLRDHVIPAAPPTLAELRRRGKRVLFVTNDPRSLRGDYAERLHDMGIEAQTDEILSCGWATAQYLRQHHVLQEKSVYVVGSEGLKDEMRSVGLQIVDGRDAMHADFVVVGGHGDFNYTEMMLACFAVGNGAHFYTTNRDATFPTPDGVVPATGAVLAGIEVASGQTAVSIGKPEPGMIEVARSLLGPGKMIMVGDRLDSDIAGGLRAGIGTALVLTGVTTRQEGEESEWRPDYILEDVSGLRPRF